MKTTFIAVIASLMTSAAFAHGSHSAVVANHSHLVEIGVVAAVMITGLLLLKFRKA